MRRIISLCISFACAMSLAVDVHSQVLTGHITDANGQPLPFASVYTKDYSRSTIADKNGSYALDGLKAGQDTIIFSCIGYEAALRRVEIANGASATLDVQLQAREIELGEVVVHGRQLPGGILDSVIAHRKPAKAIRSHSGKASVNMESVGNLGEFPSSYIKTMQLAMSLAGFGQLFKSLRENPDLRITATMPFQYANGKMTIGEKTISVAGGSLDEKQKQAYRDKAWNASSDYDEKVYSWVEEIRQKDKKSLKKSGKRCIKLKDSYAENGRTIYVLSCDGEELRIADGCWQVAGFVRKEKESVVKAICKEVFPGIFRPITIEVLARLDLDESHKWSLARTTSLEYANSRQSH